MVVLLEQAAEAAQVKLEPSAGDVWRYVATIVIPVLCGVIALMARHIQKDNEGDKQEAKEREARLNALLEKRQGGGS